MDAFDRELLDRAKYKETFGLIPEAHPDPDDLQDKLAIAFESGAEYFEDTLKDKSYEGAASKVDTAVRSLAYVSKRRVTPEGGLMLFLSEGDHILFEPGPRFLDGEDKNESMMIERAENEAHKNRQELSQLLSDVQDELFEQYGLLVRDNRFDPEERGLVIFLRNGKEREYSIDFPEEIPRKMLEASADLTEGYRVKVGFDKTFGKPKMQQAMGIITRSLRQLGYKKSEVKDMYNTIEVYVKDDA